MKKNQSQYILEKSSGRRGIKIGLIVAVAIPLLALSFGLYLRQWLAEQSARAAVLPQSNALAATQPGNPVNESVAESEAIKPNPEPGLLTQRVNGIEVSARNLRVNGGQIFVDVCFDLPDSGDWTIWNASLSMGGKEFTYTGFTPLEIREIPVEGQQRIITFDERGNTNVSWKQATSDVKGLRCDTVYFDVGADLPLVDVALSIHSLAAYPREGEECTPAYLERVQRALDARGSGIQVQCKVGIDASNGGSSGLEVVKKPEAMSMDEALAMLTDAEIFLDLHGIRGPWIFNFIQP